MKAPKTIFSVIALCLVIVMGCKNDYPVDYYKGKIIALNNHIAFNDIIEIQHSVEGGLQVGQTISVGVQLTDKGYKLGDVIYFKIISSKKWVGPETADHLWTSYTGTVGLYQN
jgi:hypothetical protein